MTHTTALWLIPLAVLFYGIVCWAIGWQMRGEAEVILPDAIINADATPVDQFPTTKEWVERNRVKPNHVRTI